MQEFLKKLENFKNIENWKIQKEEIFCSNCYKKVDVVYNDTNICPFCCSKIIVSEMMGFAEARLALYDDLENILTDDKRIFEKMIALSYLPYQENLNNSKIKKAVELSVSHLGFDSGHPISRYIRMLAMAPVAKFFEDLKNQLFSRLQDCSWMYYANVVLLFSEKYSHSDEFRALYLSAVLHEDENIRQFVLKNVNCNFKLDIDSISNVLDDYRFVTGKDLKTDYDFFLQYISIQKDFNLDSLKSMFEYVLNKFSHDLYILFLSKQKTRSRNKAELVAILTAAFYFSENMNFWILHLEETKKKILNYFANTERSEDIKFVEEKLGYHGVIGTQKNSTYKIDFVVSDPFFNLFDFCCINRDLDYHIVLMKLKPSIVKLYRKHIPLSKEYQLISLSEYELIHNDKSLVFFKDDEAFLQKINSICKFAANGYIVYNSTGKTLLKSTFSKFKEMIGIKEFFPEENGDLANIRADFLLSLFEKIKDKKMETPISNLKDFVLNLLDINDSDIQFVLKILQHLSYRCPQKPEPNNYLKIMLDILKEISDKEWVSYQALYNLINLKYKHFCPIDKSLVFSYMNFREDQFLYFGTKVINDFYFTTYFFDPFIKGVLYLFSAIGIIDIAYFPYDKQMKSIYEYTFSPYLMLDYVKVTDFGKYIFDITDKIIIPEDKIEHSIMLDNKELIIFIEGNDDIVKSIVSKMGKKISDNSYCVDCESFLEKCKDEKDVEMQISIFYNQISKNPPEIWINFFENLRKRANSFTCESGYQIFKVKDSIELRNAIISDEQLGKLILKAENFHILIKKADYAKVKKIMKKYGFLI